MAMGFGNHLGLADDKLQLLGMAGLLHDVGKMRIDPEILNKPGKLTAEEFDLIKRHPAFGLEALQAQPGIPRRRCRPPTVITNGSMALAIRLAPGRRRLPT